MPRISSPMNPRGTIMATWPAHGPFLSHGPPVCPIRAPVTPWGEKATNRFSPPPAPAGWVSHPHSSEEQPEPRATAHRPPSLPQQSHGPPPGLYSKPSLPHTSIASGRAGHLCLWTFSFPHPLIQHSLVEHPFYEEQHSRQRERSAVKTGGGVGGPLSGNLSSTKRGTKGSK